LYATIFNKKYYKYNSHSVQMVILSRSPLGCSRHQPVYLHVATIAITAFALGTLPDATYHSWSPAKARR